jgi:hypothetical protein
MAVVIGVALVLLIPLPQGSRATAAVLDLLHAPLFAVLAYAAARHWHLRRGGSIARIAAGIWLGLSIAGGAIEGAQLLVERSPGWQDAAANTLGAAAGSLTFVALRTRRRTAVVLVAVAVPLLGIASSRPVVTLVDHYRQMRDPALLGSFEDDLELSRWSPHEAAIERSREHVAHGRWSLRVGLTTATYTGVGSRHLPRDWSRYDELVFDVTLDDGPDLMLITKVYDEPHNLETEDRFNRGLRLSAGRQRLRVPLAEIAAAPRGRRMDLTRVASLQFFTVRPPEARTLWFDSIRLE